MQDSLENNERLEFLGDRVLSLVIVDLLFKKFPEEEEGELAKRHTALVMQEALVNVGNALELDTVIKLADGKSNKTIISDAMEALIGAVYLDGGFEEAHHLIERLWTNAIMSQTRPPEDAKSTLQEWAQARALPLPAYTVLSRSGADHDPQFEVEVFVEQIGKAKAIAGSKRLAEKQAAVLLLGMIDSKP